MPATTLISNRSAITQLLGIVLFALLSPALFMGRLLTKQPFDPAPLERLRQEKPEYVFIGDSMLRTRIDPEEFEKLTGARAEFLQDDGSASARWYLVFKNYLVESGVKPRQVFFFFRDWNWNWPAFRTGGKYRDFMEAASQAEEPVIDRVMVNAATGWKPTVSRFLERIYPIQERSGEARDSVHALALKLLVKTTGDPEDLDEDLEDAFQLKDLRGDVPAEMADTDGPTPSVFDPAPKDSFLPHVVALAKGHRIPVTLVRVKRRPNRPDDVRYEQVSLRPYIAGLKSYLAAEGIGWYDFTPDPEEKLSMFADGDHIADEYRAWYTRHFVEKVIKGTGEGNQP